ncbi:MAG: hypothetical protein DRP57_12730 [Spirochaetes bacterium]|nr:MAG: hypothetical protein DRP57_12730 [Spirochaetota bacterium]
MIWKNSISLSLITAVFVQLLCQLFKAVFYSLKDKKMGIHYFFSPGGMPSAHSAFVTSLTTAIGIEAGFGSRIFAVSFVFSVIVIYDAFRLRGTVELHSRALNRLYKKLPENERIEMPTMVGHSLDEIAAGIAVGVILTVLVYLGINRL